MEHLLQSGATKKFRVCLKFCVSMIFLTVHSHSSLIHIFQDQISFFLCGYGLCFCTGTACRAPTCISRPDPHIFCSVVENRLPSVYNGLYVKGLKFIMPRAPSYEVKGNVPCKIWKVVQSNDETADVWVEAKLEFNDLSIKGLLKAALSIFSSRSLENVSRAAYNVITVSAKF